VDLILVIDILKSEVEQLVNVFYLHISRLLSFSNQSVTLCEQHLAMFAQIQLHRFWHLCSSCWRWRNRPSEEWSEKLPPETLLGRFLIPGSMSKSGKTPFSSTFPVQTLAVCLPHNPFATKICVLQQHLTIGLISHSR
jgi:hypothetical protein